MSFLMKSESAFFQQLFKSFSTIAIIQTRLLQISKKKKQLTGKKIRDNKSASGVNRSGKTQAKLENFTHASHFLAHFFERGFTVRLQLQERSPLFDQVIGVGIIAIKIERKRIYFLSNVFTGLISALSSSRNWNSGYVSIAVDDTVSQWANQFETSLSSPQWFVHHLC